MKRWTIAALLLLGLSITFSIESVWAARFETELELGNGYRVDELDWNIAGNLNGTGPNILSELTWRDIESYQVKLGGRSLVNEVFYVRGSMALGWILSGENQDSDYNADNRTQEFSRSISQTDERHLFDASAGFGYQLRLASRGFRLIPVVGYAYSEQNLTLTDGFQVLSAPPQTQPVGPIPNLDSTYDTRWYGPWVGLDLFLDVNHKVTLFASFEYHWVDYEAEAFWNLRADPNFEHKADGTGVVIGAGGDYLFAEPWSLGLEVNVQDWSTGAGIDRLLKSDGTTVETRLNEVNWESLAIMLRLTYRLNYFYRR